MVDPLAFESLTHPFLLRKSLDVGLASTRHIRCLCLDPVRSHHRSPLPGVFGDTIHLYILSSSVTASGSRHTLQQFVILLLLHHLTDYVTALMLCQPSSVGFHSCNPVDSFFGSSSATPTSRLLGIIFTTFLSKFTDCSWISLFCRLLLHSLHAFCGHSLVSITSITSLAGLSEFHECSGNLPSPFTVK